MQDLWLIKLSIHFIPDINHDLNFLLSHNPRAYSIDRTEGANPIRQNLDNLLFAGTLYGDIIYHKAPVMMRQLELLMGAEAFKKGIREYLQTYSMNNADWEDLVSILDPLTPQDLKSWSNAWVDRPGMPEIKSITKYNENGLVREFVLIQSRKDAKSPTLGMKFGLIQNFPDSQYDI